MNDYAAYAEKPTDAAIQRIAALAEQQCAIEGRIAALEKKLAEEALGLRAIRENDLPEAMSQAGCTSYTLTDGSSVKVKRDWIISINKDRRAAALQWLIDNNLGSIIKNVVAVQFARGHFDEAGKLATELQSAHPEASIENRLDVHAQTLKATLKAELAKNAQVPPDLFNLYPLRWAEVKAPQTGGGI